MYGPSAISSYLNIRTTGCRGIYDIDIYHTYSAENTKNE